MNFSNQLSTWCVGWASKYTFYICEEHYAFESAQHGRNLLYDGVTRQDGVASVPVEDNITMEHRDEV